MRQSKHEMVPRNKRSQKDVLPLIRRWDLHHSRYHLLEIGSRISIETRFNANSSARKKKLAC